MIAWAEGHGLLTWELIELRTLFDIRKGKRLTKSEMLPGITPFVGATEFANGLTTFIGQLPNHKGNALTVAYNGSVGEAFYQPFPFWASDDVNVLYPRFELTPSIALFFVTLIRQEQYRYNYGRKWKLDTMRATRILVPVLADGTLATEWIQNFIAGLASAPLLAIESIGCAEDALKASVDEIDRWAIFRYRDLFDVRKGQRLTKDDMLPGSTRYIGATDSNNGVTAHIGQSPPHRGGQITVSYDGSIGEAFYQPEPFWASDAVNVLYPLFDMSADVALFFVTLIRQEQFRYNYGRKWRLEVMRDTTFKLPISLDGTPDFAKMASIVRACPTHAHLIAQTHSCPEPDLELPETA